MTGTLEALGCELTIFSLMLWLGSPILAAVAPTRETWLVYFKWQFGWLLNMQCAMLAMQLADGVGSQLQAAHTVMVGVPFWLNVVATGSQGSQLMVERRAARVMRA